RRARGWRSTSARRASALPSTPSVRASREAAPAYQTRTRPADDFTSQPPVGPRPPELVVEIHPLAGRVRQSVGLNPGCRPVLSALHSAQRRLGERHHHVDLVGRLLLGNPQRGVDVGAPTRVEARAMDEPEAPDVLRLAILAILSESDRPMSAE